MTHDEKVAFLLEDLGKKGIGRYTIAPPLYRLLWRLGSKVKPPLFASFWSLFVLMGVSYGVIFGLIMWSFLFWRQPPGAIIGTVVLAALFFGLCMAAYYRWQAGKLGLPRWDDYPNS